MTRDDIRKLIGGYATGSLTADEQKTLFEAALDDQELFDEMVREQSLKDMLDQPGVKPRLIAALEPKAPAKLPLWWLSVAAMAAVAIGVTSWMLFRPPPPLQFAVERAPVAPADRAEPAPPPPAAKTPVKQKTAPLEKDQPPRDEPVQVQPGSPPVAAPEARQQSPAAPAQQQTNPAVDQTRRQDQNQVQVQAQAERVQTPQGVVGGAGGGGAGQPEQKKSAKEEAKAVADRKSAPAPAASTPPPTPKIAGRLGAAGFRDAENSTLTTAPVAGLPASGRAVVPKPAKVRFAFEYAYEPGFMRVKNIGAGTLTIKGANCLTCERFTTLFSQIVAPDTTTRIPIALMYVVFEIDFTGPGDAAADRAATFELTATERNGTIEDPKPSPNSKIEFRLEIR